MDLNQRLWDLWQIPEEDRDPAIKVLSTLYGKILENPNNPKFRDLNFSKIRRKFEKAKPAFYLLYTAGFGQDVTGQRLQFNLINMKMLQAANAGLQAKIANPDDPKLLPKSQKPKEEKVIVKDKHFKEKYASSSVAKHEREEREKQEAIDRQNSSLTDENNNNESKENKTDDKDTNMDNTNDNTDNTNADGTDAAVPAKVEDTRTAEEIEKENAEVKNALAGLDMDADEMDLLAQIQSSKETTVSLNMSELVGKTKEEKIAIFKDKQKQFRKEKAQVARRNEIDREKRRRDNVRMAQEAKAKREEQQRAMIARKKKRDKQEEKLRKQRIREKIRLEKERKAKLKAQQEAAKKAAQEKAQAN